MAGDDIYYCYATGVSWTIGTVWHRTGWHDSITETRAKSAAGYCQQP
jgi:hypothetical protein